MIISFISKVNNHNFNNIKINNKILNNINHDKFKIITINTFNKANLILVNNNNNPNINKYQIQFNKNIKIMIIIIITIIKYNKIPIINKII